MKDIVICGAGGFAEEVTCLINRINSISKEWNFLGYIDKDNQYKGKKLKYGTILGDINYINETTKPLSVVIAVGKTSIIKKIVEEIDNDKIIFPNIIAPDVVFLDKDNTQIGKGNIFCTGCLISCNTQIGNFNCFNDYVSVGHNTVIGDFNAFMTATRISGIVNIGDCNYFGVNSCMVQGVRVGNNTTLAAGSALIRRTRDGYTYIGVPASPLIIKK